MTGLGNMHASTSKYRNVARNHEQDQLVLDHLEYVRHVVGKLLNRLPPNIDRDNLESAGILGLVEAAKQFNTDRGVAFKTFAYQRVRGAILDEMRRNSPFPQEVMQRIAKIRKATERFEPPISTEMLATETGLSEDEVEECLDAMRLLSVEQWGQSLADTPSGDAADGAATAERAEMQQILAEEIEQLSEQERMVVILYHLEDLRMKEIGQVLGLSESRISRLLSKAEFNLREKVKRRLDR